MKTIIYTSFECLIKTEDFEETLEQNQHLSFDAQPHSLVVYPIGKTSRPSFEINFENFTSQFYRIVQKEDKLLVFLLDGIYVKNYKLYTLSCEGEKCEIEIGTSEASFACGKNKKILNLPIQIISTECGHFRHIAYIKAISNEGEHLLAYNTKNSNTKMFKGESIEISQEGFSVEKSASGYDKIKEEYVVTKEGLKIKERLFSPLNHNPSNEMICYHFMNRILNGDFDNALALLSPSLQSSLSANSLREFFGKVSYIFPLSAESCFAISNSKNKIYKFSLSNNKITEISD